MCVFVDVFVWLTCLFALFVRLVVLQAWLFGYSVFCCFCLLFVLLFFVCLSICLFVCLFVCSFVCLFVCVVALLGDGVT